MRSFLAILSALLLGSSAASQVETYSVELSSAQEVPTVASPGTGSATVTLDVGTGALTVTGGYNGLNGGAVAAHIHGATVGLPGRRGRNVGVLVSLSQTGGTSGSISGSATLTPAEVAVVRAGLSYVNLHTSAHPGGELRGQIDSIPGTGSPGAPTMSISGAATAGGRLTLTCPPTIGSAIILIGLPTSPGVILPLPSPPACAFGPVVLGINFVVPPLVVPSPSLSVTIPAALANADLAFQCAIVDPSVCIGLSVASKIAIRP